MKENSIDKGNDETEGKYEFSTFVKKASERAKEGGSIDEWIKSHSSVTELSNYFGVSRPTIYRYIDWYDSGEWAKLPDRVLLFFKEKTGKGGQIYCVAILEHLTEQRNTLEEELDDSQDNFKRLISLKMQQEGQMDKLARETADELGNGSKELEELRVEHSRTEKEFMECSSRIKYLETKLEQVARKIAEMNQSKIVAPVENEIFQIRSACFTDGDRCMVVHNGAEAISYGEATRDGEMKVKEHECKFLLHLYAKLGNDYALIGDYKPVKDRKFFIIDDAVLSAPLFYNIVACVPDPMHNSYDWETEPPLVELAAQYSTGICDLKQKK